MPSRVRSNPVATLLAAVSAVLILVSRLNRHLWWSDWVFAAGIALLLVGAVLFMVRRR